mmetsp:Transcript_16220/g.20095  ORF Transcript_16220/g.20095 Transcript_16220/m.20095 type:complete len:118 (+) Transcript_16220:176-529(+)
MQRRKSIEKNSPQKAEVEPLIAKEAPKPKDVVKSLPFIGSPEGEGYVPKKQLFFCKTSSRLVLSRRHCSDVHLRHYGLSFICFADPPSLLRAWRKFFPQCNVSVDRLDDILCFVHPL